MRPRVLTALLLLPACGGGDDSAELRVSAAASLRGAYTDMAAAFEAAHSDVDVVTSFAASSTLARQIGEGAPADAFASADLTNMDRVAGAAATPRVFATNRPEIVVAPGNPLGITELADLGDTDLVLAVCAPEVPCGRYAAEVLASAGVAPEPDSFEANVGGVVTKVVTGEADAGIVYATDVLAAAPRASGVEIATEHNVVAEYPILALTDAGLEFVEFVLSPDGQAILRAHGFGAP